MGYKPRTWNITKNTIADELSLKPRSFRLIFVVIQPCTNSFLGEGKIE